MNIFQRLFSANKLNDVFTPNTVAKLTYVKRPIIEDDLQKYLSLPGKQIIIYGHSGGGKTTLLRNQLREINQNFIKTHCESSTTFNDLILQAFDELNRFYISERTTNSEYSISSELKAEFNGISSQLGAVQKEAVGYKNLRVVPPQLTPLKLAKFLGEINCVWIIEDFHKVSHEEKKRIADVVKIFIDSANDYSQVKIICIGAVGTARELIELDNNLNNRIAELFVPLLNDNEIETIVEKGFDLLNVLIDDDLKEKIVYYSNNLASLAHQICYDVCFHSNIKKQKFFKKKLGSESFTVAVNSYVRKNSDTFVKIYDAIVSQEYGWNVLKTFEYLEKEYLTLLEIKNNIPNGKRPTDEELANYLEQLGSSEYKEIIRLDRNSKKYSISSPFFKAFLKMKFALEQSEQKEINNKKNKKKNRKFQISNPMLNQRIIFDDKYLNSYNEILDEILKSQIRFKRKTGKDLGNDV